MPACAGMSGKLADYRLPNSRSMSESFNST
jgi:hypothetical protein